MIDYKSLWVTELNKFGVIELLHFHNGILPCHMADWISISKTCVCLEGYIFCIREKDWHIDTKSNNKKSVLLFLHKNSVLFYHWL